MKRKKSFHIFFLLVLAGLLPFFNSCKHEELTVEKENANFRPAADFIKNNYDLSLFAAAIEKSGLSATLNASGSFTVLAPDDAAFKNIGITRAADFDKMNPDSLKHLVQRHVITQRILLQNIPENSVDTRYRTLAGTEVYCTLASYRKGNSAFPDNELYFNGSSVNRKDVTISNGVLHVLSAVMKSAPGNTVQAWLSSQPKYSILVSGLKKFGFWELLAAEGPVTVFAPDNTQFENAGLTAQDIAALDPALYAAERLFGVYVLPQRHLFISDFRALDIISGTAFNVALENDSWHMMISSQRSFPAGYFSYDVTVNTAANYPYEMISSISGSNLQSGIDILADNGLIHNLKGILVLPAQALKQN